MIALAGMLVGPAKQAGMRVPPDPDNYDKDEYIHFFVFAACQLGAPMPYPSCVHDNAKVIVGISEKEIKLVTYEQVLARGFAVGYSSMLA